MTETTPKLMEKRMSEATERTGARFRITKSKKHMFGFIQFIKHHTATHDNMKGHTYLIRVGRIGIGWFTNIGDMKPSLYYVCRHDQQTFVRLLWIGVGYFHGKFGYTTNRGGE